MDWVRQKKNCFPPKKLKFHFDVYKTCCLCNISVKNFIYQIRKSPENYQNTFLNKTNLFIISEKNMLPSKILLSAIK